MKKQSEKLGAFKNNEYLCTRNKLMIELINYINNKKVNL